MCKMCKVFLLATSHCHFSPLAFVRYADTPSGAVGWGSSLEAFAVSVEHGVAIRPHCSLWVVPWPNWPNIQLYGMTRRDGIWWIWIEYDGICQDFDSYRILTCVGHVLDAKMWISVVRGSAMEYLNIIQPLLISCHRTPCIIQNWTEWHVTAARHDLISHAKATPCGLLQVVQGSNRRRSIAVESDAGPGLFAWSLERRLQDITSLIGRIICGI